jgi:hypothetical protein
MLSAGRPAGGQDATAPANVNWSSPGLVDTQLSPSKTGDEGVFSAKTESQADQAAEVYA